MFHLRYLSVFGIIFLVLMGVAVVEGSDAPAICLIGDHPGVLESDAQTAALLVCDALRKQGISVTDPVYEAPASASVYRVVLRRLGEKIIVRLSHENPVGTIITEQQQLLANIEEMIPAAPRLVEALVHDKPIGDMVDMETVVEQEARELRKISGESLWHLGIFGTFIPGITEGIDPGYGWGWSYETPAYAVGTDFRSSLIGENEENNEPTFSAWSIGGRYFFNKSNISPYVGGGLALVYAEYKTKVRQLRDFPSFTGAGEDWFGFTRESANSDWGYAYESESGHSLGAYGVVGIEALRLTQSRLNLELRIDLFSSSQDIMPITFGISMAHNYNPTGCLF